MECEKFIAAIKDPHLRLKSLLSNYKDQSEIKYKENNSLQFEDKKAIG